MRLLRRRSDPQAEAAPPAETEAGPADPRRPAGKGRPTPRRREAQRRRTGPVAPPPKTRREAYRRMREQGAERRASTREGMRSGDERYLLPRDRGPERKTVRDVVDARRNAGSLFLAVAVIYFAGYFIPDVRIRAVVVSLWLGVLLLVLADSVVLGLRIRRITRERFPDSRQRGTSLILYGVLRAIMIRRWRQPSPAVAVGDQV